MSLVVSFNFMSLTEFKVRQAKPKDKIYFLADDEGLSLKIEPNGRKSWSYRYSLEGGAKRPRVKLGVYPSMLLKDARSARDEYKLDNYSFNGSINKKIKSFKDICEEWLEFKTRNSFSDEPRCGVIQLAKKCLYKDIYPELSDIAFEDVKRYDLVAVIKKIESREVKEPVKKAYSYLNQIYDYAVAMGYCEYNIALGLNKILVNNKIKKNYPYLKQKEILDFVLSELIKLKGERLVLESLKYSLQ